MAGTPSINGRKQNRYSKTRKNKTALQASQNWARKVFPASASRIAALAQFNRRIQQNGWIPEECAAEPEKP